MKGIILAAGKGTRLYPASTHLSKTLLPIYDKPMIYYPLTTLMSAGIRDILIIVSKDNKAYFKRVQRGIADALVVGEKFIDGDTTALVLGDNVFYGEELYEHLAQSIAETEGATIFCKQVLDPHDFGVAELDDSGNVLSLEEKPACPKSNWAATGLYIYDKSACEYVKRLKPSARGELEITDLNRMYMERGKLKSQLLEDGIFWADTGTFDSLLQTSNKIQEIESTGKKLVGCPEEIALRRGFITKKQLSNWISQFSSNPYYDYLKNLL